jgi:hypothetical protein
MDLGSTYPTAWDEFLPYAATLPRLKSLRLTILIWPQRVQGSDSRRTPRVLQLSIPVPLKDAEILVRKLQCLRHFFFGAAWRSRSLTGSKIEALGHSFPAHQFTIKALYKLDDQRLAVV